MPKRRKKTGKPLRTRQALILLVLGIMLLSFIGMFAHQTLLVTDLSSDFEKKADVILGEYRTVSERYILPILDDPDLTEHQKKICDRLEVLYWKLRADLSPSEKIHVIGEMQLALRSLLLATPEESPLSLRPAFQGLRAATSGLLY